MAPIDKQFLAFKYSLWHFQNYFLCLSRLTLDNTGSTIGGVSERTIWSVWCHKWHQNYIAYRIHAPKHIHTFTHRCL